MEGRDYKHVKCNSKEIIEPLINKDENGDVSQ
jgi:hypothetical protein